ncbi:hypothetical protein JWJ90_20500 [Desulfobulbus rhabdoformis]|uniref:hypothetical protein n=1 Tax=Desulfobulbus rhabdoformis TaxID=34032 RepID=UPI00196300E3|nr:hypothetical protein [Desulfobulbus rhabdoformis]MBM9616651.1 hypothetical protein [Desulfobulbus rhabdoformis]
MKQFAPSCQECGAGIGELHSPGCQREECPQCGLALIYCRCQAALPLDEEFWFSVELAAKFETLAQADNNLAVGEDKDRMNLVESAAALRGIIEHPNALVSGVSPIGWSASGEPVFSDEALKDALNLTDDGVNHIRFRMFEQQASPSDFWC